MSSAARRLWQVIEPIHAVVYFAPELVASATPSGLARHGSTYFACRAAPLGRASAGAVTAAFYGFSPERVHRSVPSMWELMEPVQALALRASVADAALRRILGERIAEPGVSRAAELARAAAEAADLAGRSLASGNAEVRVDGAPHELLWQALTTLREHRGDGHVIALVDAGVEPCQAHVLRACSGAAEPDFLRATRGWTGEQWAGATERLQQRGWVSADGELTADGQRVRVSYESATDRLARGPFAALGERRTDELYGLLHRLAAAVVSGGGVPVERGLGSPWPPA